MAVPVFSGACRRLLGPAWLALALCAPAAAAAADKPVLTLCYQRIDVRPWRTADDQGLEFFLLHEVEKRAGVTFRFQSLPWKRCLQQLQDNAVDGAFSVSFSKDRLAIAAYPGGEHANNQQRLNYARYVLARRKGSAVQWDGKQFHHLQGPIGVQLGYSIAPMLREHGATVDEGGGAQTIEVLRKLAAKRISAAALSGDEAEYLLRNNPELAAQVELLPIPLVEKAYFLVFSHAFAAASPAVAARIWKSVEQVRTSPDYRQREARAGMPE